MSLPKRTFTPPHPARPDAAQTRAQSPAPGAQRMFGAPQSHGVVRPQAQGNLHAGVGRAAQGRVAPQPYRPQPVPKVLQRKVAEPLKPAAKPFNVQPPVLKPAPVIKPTPVVKPGPRPFTVQRPAPFVHHARAAAPPAAPQAGAVRRPPAAHNAAQRVVGSRAAGAMVQLKPAYGAHAPRRLTQPPASSFQNRPRVIQPFKFKYDIAFVEQTIDTETYVKGTYPNDEAGMVKWAGFILKSGQYASTSGGFDQLVDLTKKDEKEIRAFIKRLEEPKTKGPSNRQMFGYNNPSHTSVLGLSILEDGAHTPYDPNRWGDKESWLTSPNRNFITYSPNSRTQDPVYTQGHSNVVLGHDEGASVHWNRIGHTQTPYQNQQYNNTKIAYHGLEQRPKSNKSGGSTVRYNKPSQTLGSHPMYWDTSHQDYDPKYQKK